MTSLPLLGLINTYHSFILYFIYPRSFRNEKREHLSGAQLSQIFSYNATSKLSKKTVKQKKIEYRVDKL